MKKNLKAIPKFKTGAKERRFWEEHDSTQYVDWSRAEPVRVPQSKAVYTVDFSTTSSLASRQHQN
jgi:hypothetical protein